MPSIFRPPNGLTPVLEDSPELEDFMTSMARIRSWFANAAPRIGVSDNDHNTMKRSLCVCALSLALSMQASAIEYGVRTWKNTAGKELEAELVEGDESTVHLKLAATGKVVPVPLASLSEEDQAYTRTWIAEKEAAWKIEVVRAEECASFKNPKEGSKEVIKPTEGKILFLLEILITPPEGLTLPMFDDLKTELVLESGKAIVKYVRPRRAGDTAEGEPGEGIILYEVPEGAKPVEIRYKDNPPIPAAPRGPTSLLDR